MRTVQGLVQMEIGEIFATVIWDGDVAYVEETLIKGRPVELDHYAIRDGGHWVPLHNYIIDQLG